MLTHSTDEEAETQPRVHSREGGNFLHEKEILFGVIS